MQHVPVLIVGGSLVGLSASLFLAWRGVPNIVVEKHEGSAAHPRAMGFTERTLEYFTAVGLGGQVPQVVPGTRLRRAVVESLAGRWLRETEWTPGGSAPSRADGGVVTPHTGAAIPQDKLEPLLRARALELGAQLLQGTELVSFEQDAEGVSAVVRTNGAGNERCIRARYLIAADGASSTIREALGITREGVGHLRTVASVLFRCPQADRYLERGIQQFDIEQPGLRAFLTSYGDGRWVLMRTDGQDLDEPQRIPFIRACLGQDLAVEFIATGRWEMAGRVATRYGAGRIFLAGDAAHQLPPTRGGFGANTGIDDAWNLAWKLGFVIAGHSSPALLDTYGEERRPIAWLRHQQTFARPDHAKWLKRPAAPQALLDDVAMELGQLHRSKAIVGAGDDLPAAAPPADWQGQPGVRAPFLQMTSERGPVSSLDLVGRHFTLFAEEAAWVDAARRVSAATGVEVAAIQVGHDVQVPLEAFRRSFGTGPAGASLVRPDGIVGWRSVGGEADPPQALLAALRHTACLRGG